MHGKTDGDLMTCEICLKLQLVDGENGFGWKSLHVENRPVVYLCPLCYEGWKQGHLVHEVDGD